MKLRKSSFAFLFVLLAATSFSAIGCSSTPVEEESSDDALADSDLQSSGWELDYAKVNKAFPDEAAPVRDGHPEDAFSVIVDLGNGKKIRANTHMFTKQVNVIPYANPNVERSEAAQADGRGDSVIAQYIAPGEVGFMIKHHRPAHRSFAIGGGGPDMKENFKLQDTHVGIIVGVDREGKAGAISINNPKNYEQGAFGEASYPMIFVKPTFPQGISAEQQALYNENIRAMAVLFNTVSVFPGDYNGGDPLAARNPTEVRRHVAMMIKAIGGDLAAQAWFADPQNKIYCAELAHVSASAGILVPLAKSSVVGLKGAGDIVINDADWAAFESKVNGSWPFATGPVPSSEPSSANARLADLANYKPDFARLANLAPIDTVAGAPKRADGLPGKGLAFEPMTMADIVQHFLRTHIPRDPDRQQGTDLEGAGETVAKIQGGILAQMEAGLYESMKIEAGSPQLQRAITSDEQLMTLPQRLGAGEQVEFHIKDVFDALVKVVGQSYASYGAFQAAVQSWLMVARKITGPRGDSGEGLFAPPSLLHTIAQGAHPGGYLGLKYLGHGVHFSAVKKSAGAAGANTDRKHADPPAGPAAPNFQNL